jgi:hypothetical protein
MISEGASQAVNQVAVTALLNRANDSLANAIQRLNGDRSLELQRQWLELLLAALRRDGMYGLHEALKGTKDEAATFQERAEAAQAIGDAEAAVREAAGLLYHDRAFQELKKASEAIGALQRRVAASGSTPLIERVGMGEDYVSLRKFAGMLMGQGLSEKKLKGLANAREAWNEKRRLAKEDARLAKNRGATRVSGS